MDTDWCINCGKLIEANSVYCSLPCKSFDLPRNPFSPFPDDKMIWWDMETGESKYIVTPPQALPKDHLSPQPDDKMIRWDIEAGESKYIVTLPPAPSNSPGHFNSHFSGIQKLISTSSGVGDLECNSEESVIESVEDFHRDDSSGQNVETIRALTYLTHPTNQRSHLDALTGIESMSDTVHPLRVAASRWVFVVENLSLDGDVGWSDELMSIQAALSALTWVIGKYQSASVALPGIVIAYTRDLTQFIYSWMQFVETQNHSSKTTSFGRSPPHIASIFLVENSIDNRHRLGEDGFPGKTLIMNDFNGRRAYVPLELCGSWLDLCTFLGVFLRGEQGCHFITSQKFGLRIPDREDLLYKGLWDSWIHGFNGETDATVIVVDLYAIMNDDSDSCPGCKMQNPVQVPLPYSFQQCTHCGFAFLESYQSGSGQNLEDINSTSSYSPGWPDKAAADDSSSTRLDLAPELGWPNAEMFKPSFVSSSLNTDSNSLPKHVQVLRRRKPLEQENQSQNPTSPTGQYLSPVLPSHHSVPTPPKPSNIFHHLYICLLLFQPHRYRENVATISLLGGAGLLESEGSGRGPSLAFCQEWNTFRECLVAEWTQLGGAAWILLGVLFTTLQISSAADDPIVRTIVQLSISFSFFGVVYSYLLGITLGNLKSERKALAWLHDISGEPMDTLWNSWIMLSLPLVWVVWGVICFALFLMTFLWRSGATDESDEDYTLSRKLAYGPRAITSLIFILGTIYLTLTILRVRRIGVITKHGSDSH